MKSLTIGLDFDGVGANTPLLKQEVAKDLFGISISLAEIKRENCIRTDRFTKESYGLFQDTVYSIYKKEIAGKSYELKPIPGYIEYSKKLKEEGHNLWIISLRKEGQGQSMEEFLKNNSNFPYVTTNQKPKWWYCFNFDVFVDDSVSNLQEMEQHRKNMDYLFLFDAPYNADEKVSGRIKRIKGWENLYSEICEIAKGA